jgi:arginyl-tRNA--protein-N-Asp/Glu arginylyltransferase
MYTAMTSIWLTRTSYDTLNLTHHSFFNAYAFIMYLHWDEKTITDFSPENILGLYDRGYVFTRLGKGIMQQTRSVRIDLSKFSLTSENRRILKKIDGISLAIKDLPLKEYDYTLGRDAKYFYDVKFGVRTMSVQKIKEMLTDPAKSNFTNFLIYERDASELGYAIVHAEPLFLHYSYPFYHIDQSPKDMGLGMMTMAIEWAKDAGKRYIYLGSLQRPGDTYKLQFEGIEWFDGKEWKTDLNEVKRLLTK